MDGKQAQAGAVHSPAENGSSSFRAILCMTHSELCQLLRCLQLPHAVCQQSCWRFNLTQACQPTPAWKLTA